MADLRHLLAIYVHAHLIGNSVPPRIDAEARATLAAEPPAPDPREALAARPLLEAVARLGDCIGQHTVGEIRTISDRAAAWLREHPPGQLVAIEPRGCPTPGACSCVEPPAPAPAADGEREELAQWLDNKGRGAWPCPDGFSAKAEAEEYEMFSGLTRAAALLREARPQPVPGWQPIDTAPQDGTEILASDYDAIEIVNWSWDAWETGSGWIDRNGQRLFPAWWQPLQDHPPIPQPPQGGEVES